MLGNLRWSSAEKFDDRVVAQVEIIGTAKIGNGSERHHPTQMILPGCEGECEVSSSRMAGHNKAADIKLVLLREFGQKTARRLYVL